MNTSNHKTNETHGSYIKDDRIHELKGIVLGAQHYVQTHGVGVTETRHRTDTALHLFVSREK